MDKKAQDQKTRRNSEDSNKDKKLLTFVEENTEQERCVTWGSKGGENNKDDEQYLPQEHFFGNF